MKTVRLKKLFEFQCQPVNMHTLEQFLVNRKFPDKRFYCTVAVMVVIPRVNRILSVCYDSWQL